MSSNGLNAQEIKAGYYQNPIILGFNPDPSICKVGKDYYIVTSSFEYFPGVPIYHSTDLVHWEMIGHVLHRPSQLVLDDYESGLGIFAPCIRYNKGTFYMITTLVGKGKGNFVCTASKPEGPWSEPHFITNAPGIDPDLFFDDDGKVYMTGTFKPKVQLWGGHKYIWTQELNTQTWELEGEQKTIFDGNDFVGIGSPLEAGKLAYLVQIEGPHIYKKDGWYYASFSHGGTGHNHAFSIFRSKNVFGPYQSNPNNPILTHRDLPTNHPITATGHADLVQISGNDWALVYLGKRPFDTNLKRAEGERFLLGRETFISMVDWSGEWPVVNPKGKIGRSELVQISPMLKPNIFDKRFLQENFDAKTLHPQWTFIRTLNTNWWSLSKRDGFLNIQVRPEVISEKVNPSFICKRQEDMNFTVTSKMEFTPQNNNEEAGLLIERDRFNYIKYTVIKENNQLMIKLVMRKGKETIDILIAQTAIESGDITFKISAKGVNHSFSYSSNGKDYKLLKENLDLGNNEYLSGGIYTGPMIGMYATSNGELSKNIASFDYFYYQTP
jgi:alpha-N-arabinofuranosidase